MSAISEMSEVFDQEAKTRLVTFLSTKDWSLINPKYNPDGTLKPRPNISRNEKCPCGSDKKYKNCCLTLNPKFSIFEHQI